MSRRVQDNVLAVLFAGVFVYVILACLDFGPRARLVPLPVATLGLVLIVVQIVWQNLRPADKLRIDLLDTLTSNNEENLRALQETSDEPESPPTMLRPGWKNESIAFGVVGLMLALTLALGPIPAVLLFTAGYFISSGQYTWVKAVLYSAVFTAAIYVLFVVALDVQVYHGLLEPLVERWR